MHPIVRTLAFSVLLVLSETPPAAADPVLEWNTAALHAAGSASFNPPLEARNLAIVHAAIFDAANAFRGEFRPYAVRLQPPAGASQDAAMASAAPSEARSESSWSATSLPNATPASREGPDGSWPRDSLARASSAGVCSG